MTQPRDDQATQVAPFGSWASPVRAADLAEAAVQISDVRIFDGQIYWRESRPAEGGRMVLRQLTDDGPQTLTPAGYSVRTRVHEYGGSSYWIRDGLVIFANFSDQRLYLQRPGEDPQPLTPAGYQYADAVFTPAGDALICVREDHTDPTRQANGEERNEIVWLPLPAAGATAEPQPGRVLVTGTDFVAYPRLDASGRQLAWIDWDHPHMPWDQTRLRCLTLDRDGRPGPIRTISSGQTAALEPQWAADGTLYYIDETDDERGGWWNLHRWRDGHAEPVTRMPREFGGPLWTLGMQSYVIDPRGRLLARSALASVEELAVIDPADGDYRPLPLPFVAFGDLQLLPDGRLLTVAYARDDEPALVAIDPDTAQVQILHRTAERRLPAEFVSVARSIEFPTRSGEDGQARTAQANYYPPANPQHRGPPGAKPPLLVMVHGGPTGASEPTYSLARQYWTTRGFALVDVNYGGSTSFGRAYRQRLKGQWGIVDVADAIAAVDHLVAAGEVDPERVAIRGGSAGGYTTLAALASSDRFRAGANYYGVSDVSTLAGTSHKFESRYDVSLMGSSDPARYHERSPINHLDGFTAPLITFQGSEDRIVTPDQSRRIVQALAERQIPHAYLEFPGEQHGFRQAANIIRAQEAELWFYGRVFGFQPADAIEAVPLHGRALPEVDSDSAVS
ncbi:MAG: prolyl oligopeptidase family serine peptidase [Lysobacterales bacterium]